MTTRFDETNIDIDFSQAHAWNAETPERTRWLRANAVSYTHLTLPTNREV